MTVFIIFYLLCSLYNVGFSVAKCEVMSFTKFELFGQFTLSVILGPIMTVMTIGYKMHGNS